MKKPVPIRRRSPVGKVVALALAILLVLAGSVWGVREKIESRRAASNLAEVERLRELQKSEAYKQMAAEERQQFRKDLREKYNKLPFEERKRRHAEWAAKGKEFYDAYVNASPEQREAMDRQMAEKRPRRGKSDGDGKDNGSSGKRNNSGGPPGGSGQGSDSDSSSLGREARRRLKLDMQTPDERAQKSAMRQMKREQQQQGR
jgi:hypothetical protein